VAYDPAVPDLMTSALAKPATKAFFAAVLKLAKANDEAARAEYRESIDAMVLEMYTEWASVDADELPTADDVLKAARDLEDERERASGNRKREILNRAFLGRFNPRLYREGVTQMLWDYARQLEYPEARLLAELVTEVKACLSKHSESMRLMPEEWPSIEFTARQVQIKKSDIRYELARRLDHVGLVEIEDHPSLVNVAPILGIAEKLREFIWGDGSLPDE
jgi:hypothetical protein